MVYIVRSDEISPFVFYLGLNVSVESRYYINNKRISEIGQVNMELEIAYKKAFKFDKRSISNTGAKFEPAIHRLLAYLSDD